MGAWRRFQFISQPYDGLLRLFVHTKSWCLSADMQQSILLIQQFVTVREAKLSGMRLIPYKAKPCSSSTSGLNSILWYHSFGASKHAQPDSSFESQLKGEVVETIWAISWGQATDTIWQRTPRHALFKTSVYCTVLVVRWELLLREKYHFNQGWVAGKEMIRQDSGWPYLSLKLKSETLV